MMVFRRGQEAYLCLKNVFGSKLQTVSVNRLPQVRHEIAKYQIEENGLIVGDASTVVAIHVLAPMVLGKRLLCHSNYRQLAAHSCHRRFYYPMRKAFYGRHVASDIRDTVSNCLFLCAQRQQTVADKNNAAIVCKRTG